MGLDNSKPFSRSIMQIRIFHRGCGHSILATTWWTGSFIIFADVASKGLFINMPGYVAWEIVFWRSDVDGRAAIIRPWKAFIKMLSIWVSFVQISHPLYILLNNCWIYAWCRIIRGNSIKNRTTWVKLLKSHMCSDFIGRKEKLSCQIIKKFEFATSFCYNPRRDVGFLPHPRWKLYR